MRPTLNSAETPAPSEDTPSTLVFDRQQEEFLPDITMPKLSLDPQHLGTPAGLGHCTGMHRKVVLQPGRNQLSVE